MDVPITPFFTEEQPKADMGSPVISKINAHLMDMTEDQQRDFLWIIRIFHGYLPEERAQMGLAGRAKMERVFNKKVVVKNTIHKYLDPKLLGLWILAGVPVVVFLAYGSPPTRGTGRPERSGWYRPCASGIRRSSVGLPWPFPLPALTNCWNSICPGTTRYRTDTAVQQRSPQYKHNRQRRDPFWTPSQVFVKVCGYYVLTSITYLAKDSLGIRHTRPFL